MRAGRDEAFSDFVLSARGDLVPTATLLAAGDRHLAEDLVQVSLTRLYVAWGRLRDRRPGTPTRAGSWWTA